MTSIILVEKSCTLKCLTAKTLCEADLYKKCGFKKPDGFECHAEWCVKIDGVKYKLLLYGKTNGRANTENKYDFPPPADNVLFFGTCAVVCKDKATGEYSDLTQDMWEKAYETLFGGFEDLSSTAKEDDAEEDELQNVPKELKTKDGYLKDGFVVDEEEESGSNAESSEQSFPDDDASTNTQEEDIVLEDLEMDDIDSELDEEDYCYSSDDDEK